MGSPPADTSTSPAVRRTDGSPRSGAVRQKWTPLLVKAWQRATQVDEREVQAHIPTTSEIKVAEALVNTAGSLQSICDHTGLQPGTVRGVLADPTAVAWISRQIAAQVQNRLGLIDAALFRSASAGNIAAIRLFYERFDKLARIAGGVSITQVNYGAMPDDDLRRLATARIAEFSRIIDASPAPGPPGDSRRDAGTTEVGAAALLPPPR